MPPLLDLGNDPQPGAGDPQHPRDGTARAVERELARRKRLIMICAVLLVVPIVMGLVAVYNGQTDTTRLKTVEANLQEVQPSIQKIRGLDTALTQVAAVSSTVKANSGKVAKLERDQAALQQNLSSTMTALRDSQRTLVARTEELRMQLVPTQDSLRQVRVQFAQVQMLVTRQSEQLKNLESVQHNIQVRQEQQEATIRANRESVQRLQVRTDSLDARQRLKTLYQQPR